MKEFKTKNYIEKKAQFNTDLPGDPGLPSGVSDQIISDQFDGGDSTDYSKQAGEYETKVDWAEETQELVNAGYDVMGLPQRGLGDIKVYFEYDAQVYGGDVTISNIRLLDIKVLMGGQYQALTVKEPATKEGLFEGLQEEIVEQERIIIKEQHEGSIGIRPDRTEELY
jgi:hypothetical protein